MPASFLDSLHLFKGAGTWNRYASVIGACRRMALAFGTPWSPGPPGWPHALRLLAGRYSQTIAAFSGLANLPLPDKHPLVLMYRQLALHTKTFHRGRIRHILREHIRAGRQWGVRVPFPGEHRPTARGPSGLLPQHPPAQVGCHGRSHCSASRWRSPLRRCQRRPAR